MTEDASGGANTGSISKWDPVLISLVRRAMPNLMAYDVCGVQPMSGPTGLIFAMKSRYDGGSIANDEALFNEADTGFSGRLVLTLRELVLLLLLLKHLVVVELTLKVILQVHSKKWVSQSRKQL